MKKVIKKILRKFGIEIKFYFRKSKIKFWNDLNHNLGYEYENEANKAITIVRKNTMLPYKNLVTLFEQARFIEISGIKGDFVECGVWKGGAVGLMALANMHYAKECRDIHLFDAFTEICAPDATKDGEKAVNEVKTRLGASAKVSGELEPLTGIYDKYGGPSSIEENKELLEKTIQYPNEKLHYHIGWFQDTMSSSSKQIESISILRVDSDWYESTKICLEHLYDKVVPGGIVIIDDYGRYEGCKKAVDEFMIKRNIKYFLNYSTTGCRYWFK